MSDSLQERVARGAAYLDERTPGWWKRVDLEALNLGDSCDCILGQVDRRGYWLSCRDRSLSDEQQWELGFHAGHFASAWVWNGLENHWIAEIKRRREAAP